MTKGGEDMEFKITYFFDGDVRAEKVVEANDIEEVSKKPYTTAAAGLISFTNEKNVFYRFDLKDVKLIKIEERKRSKVMAKPSHL